MAMWKMIAGELSPSNALVGAHHGQQPFVLLRREGPRAVLGVERAIPLVRDGLGVAIKVQRRAKAVAAHARRRVLVVDLHQDGKAPFLGFAPAVAF